MSYQQKRTDKEYLLFDPFTGSDRDVHIECQTWKVVTTKKDHHCAVADLLGTPHQIPDGTKALRESAKVDGQFGSCWSCLECCDKQMDIEDAYQRGEA